MMVLWVKLSIWDEKVLVEMVLMTTQHLMPLNCIFTND